MPWKRCGRYVIVALAHGGTLKMTLLERFTVRFMFVISNYMYMYVCKLVR